MPLGGVTDELVDLRLALWSRKDTRQSLQEYYERLFSPECEEYLFDDDELALEKLERHVQKEFGEMEGEFKRIRQGVDEAVQDEEA